MAVPGSIGSQMPPGEDALVRKIADLERSMRELAPSVAESFASTVAELQAAQDALAVQQTYQASLVTKALGGASVDLIGIPGDQTYRFFATSTAVTLPVTTGRALITVGSSLLRVDVGNSSVEAIVTFSVENSLGETVYAAGDVFAAKFLSNVAGSTGAGVSFTTPYLVASKGVRTFRLNYGHWSDSTAPLGNVRIVRPYIQVQIIPDEVV